MGRESEHDTGSAGNDIATLVEKAGVGVIEISPVGTFETVNEAFAELVGYSPTELQGESVTTVFPQADVASIVATLLDVPAEKTAETTVVPVETKRGERRPCEIQLRSLGSEVGERGFVGVVRPVSGKQENEPAQFQTARAESAWAQSFLSLAQAIPDGIIVLDADSDILYANPAVEDILGHAPADLVGGSKLQIIPPRLRELHLAALERYLETGERHINWEYVELPGQHADGHEVPLGISLNEFTIGEECYFVGLFRDITPRKEAKAEALTRLSQQEAIAEFGRHALETTDIDQILDDAVELLAELLGAEIAMLFELQPDETLQFRRAYGFPDDEELTLSVASDSFLPYTLAAEESVVISNFETESRFEIPTFLLERGMRSGIGTLIGAPESPWGVLSVHEKNAREFSEKDIHAIENVANIIAAAADRHERTERIESQRTQLDAITQVYRVVQEIQQAVIRQSSPEEIEQIVCERLTDIDLCKFAWIGHVDLSAETISPNTKAGMGAGYLDEIELDMSDEHTQKLGGRAIETQQTQIVSDIATDDRFAPWREPALQRGFRSLAIVPIVYQQRVFGLLGIYAGEPEMFRQEVREVFDALGELLGHSLMSLSQRQALHADEVTEITFQIEGALDMAESNPFAGHRLQFDRILPVDEGQFLAYGFTTLPAEQLGDIESLPIVESVTILSHTDSHPHIELELLDPPLTSLVASFGGRIKRGILEDDVMTMTVQLPPTVKVKTLIEQIEGTFSEGKVTLEQRMTRERDAVTKEQTDLLAPLTDRQRTALEAAYYSGYFEWPRESKAVDVAESLDISNATFSQHLRSAERQIFTQLFEDRRTE